MNIIELELNEVIELLIMIDLAVKDYTDKFTALQKYDYWESMEYYNQRIKLLEGLKNKLL